MPDAKVKNIFVCSHCDAQFPKWSGRCSECGSWGTLNEETEIVDAKAKSKKTQQEAFKKIVGADIIDLAAISSDGPERFLTGLREIDRVLGGGLPAGSLILLAGEPGIGKSTLAAQLANALKGKEVFYVSGEESAPQVKARLARLNCDLSHLKFLSETNIEKIAAAALKLLPDLIIVDSIQTVYSADLMSAPGRTAPEGSAMWPRRTPVRAAWARANVPPRVMKANKRIRRRAVLFVTTTSHECNGPKSGSAM